MNRKQMILTTGCVILLLSSFISVSQADAPTPGSSTDPVITKSYFDQNTLSEAKVKELVTAALAANGGSQPSAGGSTSATMKVVQLQNGQTLYAGAGAEFIVRSGKVLAVSNDENGIPDVTGGKDLAAGTEIALNHLLIFPTEGRGIKPTPKNTADIFVMVRGGYLILNADGSKVTQ
ncbi:hypothetical protein BC351_31890 [Paenibacillus ferrarius]|uniref:Copper amine oxidase-like N-terminal domain-containing protein n=1 Tax=Paenibacillus ferrarius TaxID=1469647 RepID=A0A1V4HGI0_9BACL|nr:hypothetical protein [Paenibacillus ferrarius]OPH54579.1 hypothetical protein BC351_31890 [Paenibacillus ferrarius]